MINILFSLLSLFHYCPIKDMKIGENEFSMFAYKMKDILNNIERYFDYGIKNYPHNNKIIIIL